MRALRILCRRLRPEVSIVTSKASNNAQLNKPLQPKREAYGGATRCLIDNAR
jgi:hypothetical protein